MFSNIFFLGAVGIFYVVLFLNLDVANICVNTLYIYVPRTRRICRCVSMSFVFLMTSLRGLLALDSGSQNEDVSYRHVFNEAPSRYMIGNFCHDPFIINIKIDTIDVAQNDMHLST